MWKSIILAFLLISLSHSSLGENKYTYHHVINKTATMLQTCVFAKNGNALLLAGEYEEFLRKSVYNSLPVALIMDSKVQPFHPFMLTNYSFALYEKYHFSKLLHKLHHFVVITSSQSSLRSLLQRIKDSAWSNSEGLFILIDKKTEERACDNAYYYLWTAWQYDLISAIFMCLDPVEGVQIYSYNPYNKNSPRTWKEVDRFKGRDRHPWRLLKRRYHSDRQVCEDLIFEKTYDLDGYPIRMNAISVLPFLQIDNGKPGLEKFTGDNAEIVKILFGKLNASLDIRIHNGTIYDLGGITSNGTMIGMLADISSGKVDMGMNTRPLIPIWKIKYTYPHAEGGLCVITQLAGKYSELRKLLSFVSLEVAIGILAICIIAQIVLTLHEGYMLASLNLIRLIVSVSMLRLPRVTSSRIFIIMILMLFIIVNALFQGHWAALLTVPVSYPNVNNLADLKKSGLSIYGAEIIKDAIGDPILQSRFHGVSYKECKQEVKKSKRAACIGDCLHLYQRIRNEKLHRSRKIRELVQVYVTREDWPLFPPANRVIQRMVEAGLVRMWRRQNVRQIFKERRWRRMSDKSGFRVLELRHLLFSFYFLGIGCACATIVFVLELFLGRGIPRNEDIRRNLRFNGAGKTRRFIM